MIELIVLLLFDHFIFSFGEMVHKLTFRQGFNDTWFIKKMLPGKTSTCIVETEQEIHHPKWVFSQCISFNLIPWCSLELIRHQCYFVFIVFCLRQVNGAFKLPPHIAIGSGPAPEDISSQLILVLSSPRSPTSLLWRKLCSPPWEPSTSKLGTRREGHKIRPFKAFAKMVFFLFFLPPSGITIQTKIIFLILW